jgi:hypothetical protein
MIPYHGFHSRAFVGDNKQRSHCLPLRSVGGWSVACPFVDLLYWSDRSFGTHLLHTLHQPRRSSTCPEHCRARGRLNASQLELQRHMSFRRHHLIDGIADRGWCWRTAAVSSSSPRYPYNLHYACLKQVHCINFCTINRSVQNRNSSDDPDD